MKIMRAVSLLLSLFVAGSALAQSVPPPLKNVIFPATERLVLMTCYVKTNVGWGGTTDEPASRNSLSEFGQKESDTFVSEFSKKMTEAGFSEIAAIPRCETKDDEAGGITVSIKISFRYAFGREDVIGVQSLIKIPGRRTFITAGGKFLNGMKGVGAVPAAEEMSAEVVKQVRMYQTTQKTPDTLPAETKKD